MSEITFNDFKKVDIRVGKIIDVEDLKGAKIAAYKMKIDFGPLGIKKTIAQITKLYSKEELMNKQIAAVVNFPPKQIANALSEVLVLGIVLDNKEVILLQPEREAPLGYRVA